MSEKIKKVYVCGIAWQHEIEDDALLGISMYPSVYAAKKLSEHDMEECGLVECEIRFIRWVIPQDLEKNLPRTAETQSGEKGE